MIILLHCAWESPTTKLPTLLVDLDQVSEPTKTTLEEAVRSKPRQLRLTAKDACALYDSAKEALAELPALVETSVIVLEGAMTFGEKVESLRDRAQAIKLELNDTDFDGLPSAADMVVFQARKHADELAHALEILRREVA